MISLDDIIQQKHHFHFYISTYAPKRDLDCHSGLVNSENPKGLFRDPESSFFDFWIPACRQAG
ncbi:hypothetical protein A3D77_04580 [Candidatus Gottesmanbacteria bacterium RIFCSPHIGHO2_02_FULL_39_11]|uniref:Uncharacterized protein n=1 Tax=Candidatus Gottesmanbacteria bacterium RIFCSPHIGHO2_02_FULL_39_11 TaxID=1798382 RepID=A0A1F5ZJB9_9BACT|nr:MAG: hypothetical protein A3D77_04580 [Candidatus Gottesmanbacteria bacterium RIFCSPHIGHO2_02_FULL_39_11]